MAPLFLFLYFVKQIVKTIIVHVVFFFLRSQIEIGGLYPSLLFPPVESSGAILPKARLSGAGNSTPGPIFVCVCFFFLGGGFYAG